MNSENNIYKPYRKQNHRNFILYCFVSAIIGTEYGFIVPTLYSYLKDSIRPKHLELWFGIITASYFISSTIGSQTIAKYADRTREIRRIILCTCVCVSLGNIAYAVSNTAFLVLIGRFTQGFGDAVLPVLIGEITKTYDEKESYSKLSTMISIYYVTYISSPIITTVFSWCNFNYLGIHFTVYNLPAYIISTCWFVLGIVSYFIVSNPINSHTDTTEESNINKNQNKRNGKKIKQPEMLSNRELLSCPQYRIILFLTGLVAYFTASFFTIYIPMVAKTFYNLPAYWTSSFFASCGITLVVVLTLSSKYDIMHQKEIYFLVWGCCSIVISVQLLCQAIIFNNEMKIMGEVFLALSTLTIGFTFSIEQVLLSGFVAKFIPISTQAYAASIRRSFYNVCFITGSFVAPLISGYMLTHCIIYSCVVCLVAWFLIYERRMFEKKVRN